MENIHWENRQMAKKEIYELTNQRTQTVKL